MTIRFITLISRLSFRKLYFLADIVYLLLYHVVGYRKKVVRKNLLASFPELSEKERLKIEHDFYHWLCDYFVETIKLLTITPEQLHEHFEVHGMEHVTEAMDRGQNISTFLGHYANWEFGGTVWQYLPATHQQLEVGLIYHPLRNATAEELMRRARSSMGGKCIKKQDILREIVTCRRENQPYMLGYVFDQTPKWENIYLWLDFMHQDTPVFTGGERLTRKYKDAAIYMHIERPERGKYIARLVPITLTPDEEPEYAITRRCFELLEEDIHKQPHLYLWSHNRWKRTREGWEHRNSNMKHHD